MAGCRLSRGTQKSRVPAMIGRTYQPADCFACNRLARGPSSDQKGGLFKMVVFRSIKSSAGWLFSPELPRVGLLCCRLGGSHRAYFRPLQVGGASLPPNEVVANETVLNSARLPWVGAKWSHLRRGE